MHIPEVLIAIPTSVAKREVSAYHASTMQGICMKKDILQSERDLDAHVVIEALIFPFGGKMARIEREIC